MSAQMHDDGCPCMPSLGSGSERAGSALAGTGRCLALLAHAIHGVAALCLQDGQRRSLLHSQQPKRSGPHRGGKPGLRDGTVRDY